MCLIFTDPVTYSASSVIRTLLIQTLAYLNFVHGRSDIIKLLTHPQYWRWTQALQYTMHTCTTPPKVWFLWRANPTAGSSQAVKQQHGSLHVYRKAKASCFIHWRESRCYFHAWQRKLINSDSQKTQYSSYPNISLIRTPSPPKGSDNWGCTVCSCR